VQWLASGANPAQTAARGQHREDQVRLLAVIGVLAIIIAAAAAFFFVGGYYSVAATSEDPGVVNWALIQVREASISHHATELPPGSLDDPAQVRAGAHAFAARGCVNCHGAPGMQWAKFSEGLNPSPPDLKDVAKELQPSEIFWIVKNGIKMTGMPSFAQAGVPDPEIWSIVAFVKHLPTVSDADFKAWSMSGP
jgi:mono/diheme cytochrome c family protein